MRFVLTCRPLAAFLSRIMGGLMLVVGLSLLSGCSAVKLGYANLDTISYWWLDGYFDFDNVQSDRAKASLTRLHTWHRTQELPLVVEWLGRQEQRVLGDITPAQVCNLLVEVQPRIDAVIAKVEPEALALIKDTRPEQIKHLAGRHAKNNADFRRDWIDAPEAERRDRRFKQLVERFEMVYSRLEPQQTALLRAHVERSGFDAAQVLAERQGRQRDLIKLLERGAARAPDDELLRGMRALVARTLAPTEPTEPAARRYAEAQRNEGCALAAQVHNAATPAQREQAQRRLRTYQRDFTELAGRG